MSKSSSSQDEEMKTERKTFAFVPCIWVFPFSVFTFLIKENAFIDCSSVAVHEIRPRWCGCYEFRRSGEHCREIFISFTWLSFDSELRLSPIHFTLRSHPVYNMNSSESSRFGGKCTEKWEKVFHFYSCRCFFVSNVVHAFPVFTKFYVAAGSDFRHEREKESEHIFVGLCFMLLHCRHNTNTHEKWHGRGMRELLWVVRRRLRWFFSSLFLHDINSCGIISIVGCDLKPFYVFHRSQSNSQKFSPVYLMKFFNQIMGYRRKRVK